MCSVKISAELYIVYLRVYSIRYVRLFTRPRPDRILNFSRKSRENRDRFFISLKLSDNSFRVMSSHQRSQPRK